MTVIVAECVKVFVAESVTAIVAGCVKVFVAESVTALMLVSMTALVLVSMTALVLVSMTASLSVFADVYDMFVSVSVTRSLEVVLCVWISF